VGFQLHSRNSLHSNIYRVDEALGDAEQMAFSHSILAKCPGKR
jgi:hypothetical protein